MRLCKYCNTEMAMFISLYMSMPSSLEHKITKTSLRKSSVRILGAEWYTATFVCPECGYRIRSAKERNNDRL